MTVTASNLRRLQVRVRFAVYYKYCFVRNMTQELPEAFVQDVASRLANLTSLTMPNSLLKDNPHPNSMAKQDYLRSLLARDPALFLERHGSLLTSSEVQGFAPLQHNYEVRWWCEQLQPSAQTQVQLRTTLKQRRMAYMNTVLMNNGYFDDYAMYIRAPGVYEAHVGEYQPAPPPGEAGAEGMATWFLNQHDVAVAAAALRQELNPDVRFGAQQQRSRQPGLTASCPARAPSTASFHSEHESEEDDITKSGAADLSTGGGAAGEGGEVLHSHTARGDHTTGCAVDTVLGQPATVASDGTHHIDKVVRSAANTSGAAPTAAFAVAGAAAAADSVHRLGQGDMLGRAGSLSSNNMAQELLYVMQQRFLDGQDQDYVDYAAIDADTRLDDYFAATQQQDAEDKYFADV